MTKEEVGVSMNSVVLLIVLIPFFVVGCGVCGSLVGNTHAASSSLEL